MKRLLGDLRALGWWAPVRAVYEAASRLGIIGRTLQAVAGRSEPRVPTSPFTARPWLGGDVPPGTADEIVAGSLVLLGRAVHLGDTPDWHQSDRGGPWPRRARWKIRLRPGDGRDVKHVFELGRHAHLVTLAAAAAAADDPRRYVAVIERHLDTWFEQNPPEVGIHWYSSLEVALRSVSWLAMYDLVGPLLEPSTVQRLGAHLYHSGRHIVAELPYTLSSMRNNHLVGDAVGLAAIGRAFPGDRRARRWARLGDRMLRGHLPRHVHEDGSTIEDSLGYRAFVLDLLTVRTAMADPPDIVTRAASALSAHLTRLGVASGPVPHFGDWDGGSAGAAYGDTPPALGALRRSTAAVPPGTVAVDDGGDAGGSVGRAERGPWTVWLKCGADESHGHSDLLSVAAAHNGIWLVGDPGTGSYNRSGEERDYFRTAVAHSVLRVGGADQRVPHRRFRWRHRPHGRLGEPFELGGYRVMWGSHDAYERLLPPATIVRACLVADDAVVVADWVLGGDVEWRLSLPLPPDVGFESRSSAAGTATGDLMLPGGGRVGVSVPGPVHAVRGSLQPFDGWWAAGYDAAAPSTRLEAAGAGAGPVVWALWTGRRPTVAATGLRLVVDGLALEVARVDGLPAVTPA